MSKIDSKQMQLMSQTKCFPFPIKTKLWGGEAIFDGCFSKACQTVIERKGVLRWKLYEKVFTKASDKQWCLVLERSLWNLEEEWRTLRIWNNETQFKSGFEYILTPLAVFWHYFLVSFPPQPRHFPPVPASFNHYRAIYVGTVSIYQASCTAASCMNRFYQKVMYRLEGISKRMKWWGG